MYLNFYMQQFKPLSHYVSLEQLSAVLPASGEPRFLAGTSPQI